MAYWYGLLGAFPDILLLPTETLLSFSPFQREAVLFIYFSFDPPKQFYSVQMLMAGYWKFLWQN
jgi:hypothetical protein